MVELRAAKVSGCLSIIYLIFAALVHAGGTRAANAADGGRPDCDPVWRQLFTPPRPQLGRYEVCVYLTPLSAHVRAGWRLETVGVLDAFGRAGRYDRTRLARLFGGRQVTLARGVVESADTVESITAISPHPDPTLSHVLDGTLLIRYVLPRPDL